SHHSSTSVPFFFHFFRPHLDLHPFPTRRSSDLFPKTLRTQYSAQYNLTVKRELPGEILLQVGYVGSQGHRLLAIHDENAANAQTDRKSTRLNSSHRTISYAVFCLKKKNTTTPLP